MHKETLDVEEMSNGKKMVIGQLENVDIPDTRADLDQWEDDYVVKKFIYGHKVALRATFKSSLKPNAIGVSPETKRLMRDGLKNNEFTERELNEWIASRRARNESV